MPVDGERERDLLSARMVAAVVAALEGDEQGMDVLLDDLSEEEVRELVRAMVWSQATQLVVTADGDGVITAEAFAAAFNGWLSAMRRKILELRVNVEA